ncbi:type VII secretion integral membrane protein EccD [Streptomyces mirabilis]
MTTSSPAVSVPENGGTQVCRITIDAPTGRFDLAVPVSTPVAVLMPVLLRHVRDDADDRGTPLLLQRLGEDPLDLDGTPEGLRLLDGDVLYLRKADAPMPGLQFDDLCDGVAQAIAERGDRWRPELTRQLLLALSCLVLAALATYLLGAGSTALTAVYCGVTAVVLIVGCVLAPRRAATEGSVLVAGLGGYGFAALAGLTAGRLADAGGAPGLHAVLLAGACAGVPAALLLVIGRLPVAVSGIMLVTAAVAELEGCLSALLGWDAVRSATVAAVVLFALGQFGPRLALRIARLRVPQLPRNANELQQDIEPEPAERVTRRVAIANACLNVLAVSSALAYAEVFWLLAHDPQWIGWVLTVVFSGAVLLRARDFSGTWQRIPTAVVGTLGLVLVLTVRTASAGQVPRSAVLIVLLVAVALMLIGAWRLPTSRLLPMWGQTGDTLQMITAMALLPLTLQVLHVYGYIRSLNG